MSLETNPLVSCIMPTCNRRAFVPHAIRYFLNQDYENKELVIVDDGSDCIKDLVPDHFQVRYMRLQKAMTLGEKRNYCIKESKGDLIMHWDDDDWMASYRISYQVKEMLSHNVEICGLKEMLFCEIETGKCWLYKYSSNARPWLAGGSLLYKKDFWKKNPFPDIQVASDTQFIFSRKLESYVALADHSFYVASIHKENTSPKKTNNTLWHLIESSCVEKIMANDWSVYSPEKLITEQPDGQKNTSANVLKQHLVSACLLSYKRPRNIQRIIDSIHHYPFIDEILVWNNDPFLELALQGSKVRVIQAAENMICYGRFLCAAEARNEIVYFQDDDAIVNNIQELYQTFLKDDSCIAHALSPRHFQVRNKYNYASGHVALLGWGAFIKKEWLCVLTDYLKQDKDDYLFRREADKFFTLLLGKKNNTLQGKIQLLEHDSTPGIALYLEKEHNFYIAQAIRKALEFNRRSREIFPPTWNVVVTCMNYGRYLEEAINSILYNHADYIITIVDDGSTDNTAAICRNLIREYPFIRYIRNEVPKGTGHARNQGIAAADSIFVVLLDADDKIGPEYLYEAEKLLRQGYDVVNPDAILFGNTVSRWPVPETVSLAMQLQRNHVHCCSAFRRSYWAQVGGFDESMNCWEDYEFWIRLAEAGARIKKISGDHFYYRKHGASRSGEPNEEKVSYDYIRSKHKHLFKKI